MFGILSRYTNKYGRDPIVLFGFIVHCVTFFLIFINVPDRAPIDPNVIGHSFLNYKYVPLK